MLIETSNEKFKVFTPNKSSANVSSGLSKTCFQYLLNILEVQ